MKHLTTGDCAKFSTLSIKTITKAIKSGDLKGFFVPGSTHRRVAPGVFVEWLRRHGIPIPPKLEEAV